VSVYVGIADACVGDDVSAGEAVTIFDDRRDAERGRQIYDGASVIERHPRAGP
jgi:hypothetical protein